MSRSVEAVSEWCRLTPVSMVSRRVGRVDSVSEGGLTVHMRGACHSVDCVECRSVERVERVERVGACRACRACRDQGDQGAPTRPRRPRSSNETKELQRDQGDQRDQGAPGAAADCLHPSEAQGYCPRPGRGHHACPRPWRPWPWPWCLAADAAGAAQLWRSGGRGRGRSRWDCSRPLRTRICLSMCGIGSVVTLLTARDLIGFEPGPQCSCRENAVVPKFSAYVT